MITPLFRGAGYFAQGVGLLRQPKLRNYLIMPLIINVLLFVVASWLLIEQSEPLLRWLQDLLPTWLEWLGSLISFILMALLTLLALLLVSLLAGLVAAPFNALLAEAVERYCDGDAYQSSEMSLTQILKSTPHLLTEELRKLRYALFWAIPLFIISWIPLLNLAAPFLWFLYGAWMLARSYLAYALDNHNIPFNEQHRSFASRRPLLLGFGSLTLLMTMVPLLNFVVIPAAVAGATTLWVKELRQVLNANPTDVSS
ncbi:MAG: sulfate transporter CysZ [Gammaproteobacteria bacterium]|nr:sulfate transporter CysZ [Gammaproteobacteria bacterium]